MYAVGIDSWRSRHDGGQAHCPGHLERLGRQDQHPTWSVNRISGLHNCYSCGFKGTFLQLVMYLLFPNDVFRSARWLRQYGSDLGRAVDLPSFAEREDSDERIAALELVPETKPAMYADVPDGALEVGRLSRGGPAMPGPWAGQFSRPVAGSCAHSNVPHVEPAGYTGMYIGAEAIGFDFTGSGAPIGVERYLIVPVMLS